MQLIGLYCIITLKGTVQKNNEIRWHFLTQNIEDIMLLKTWHPTHFRSVFFPFARVSFISHLTANFITLKARVGYTDKELRRSFSTRKAQITGITYKHAHLRTLHTRKYVTIIDSKHNVVKKCYTYRSEKGICAKPLHPFVAVFSWISEVRCPWGNSRMSAGTKKICIT